MKISFITTVFDEESSIVDLLESLNTQTLIPDEVIIVDGGSSDRTVWQIKNHPFGPLRSEASKLGTRKSKIKKQIKLKIFLKKGNRSVGRNEAIKNATNEIIVCSDAGCVPQKNWLEEITRPFTDSKIDVVAGYYKGVYENIFEKSLIPYVLVMNDKVDELNFLPAARSMAFRKSIWVKAGKFDEKLSNNEDYAFSQELKKIKANKVFTKNAIVSWFPRKNLRDSFIMFYRFALGDAESGILRLKVIFLFLRYALGFFIALVYVLTSNILFLILIIVLLLNYILWAIMKNYKYINDSKAYFYLPLLQFTSDFAVLLGTTLGAIKKLGNKK